VAKGGHSVLRNGQIPSCVKLLIHQKSSTPHLGVLHGGTQSVSPNQVRGPSQCRDELIPGPTQGIFIRKAMANLLQHAVGVSIAIAFDDSPKGWRTYYQCPAVQRQWNGNLPRAEICVSQNGIDGATTSDCAGWEIVTVRPSSSINV